AIEDSFVRFALIVERAIQPSLIDIESVRVLHNEVAHPQHAGLRSRLVAKLYLDLIPDLRQLLVRAEFVTGDRSEYFFMRHPQTHVRAFTILELEHLVAHYGPAARFFPQFARMQGGQEKLLPTNPI